MPVLPIAMKERGLSTCIARANLKRSAFRSAVEHVFVGQNYRMVLFIRSIGMARARIKIGMDDLAYNFQCLAWLQRRSALHFQQFAINLW